MKPDVKITLFGQTYSDYYDIPFKVKYYTRLWRAKWFLKGRPCLANNTTCGHCKHGYCRLHRPGLIWNKDRWACNDYRWDIEKLLHAYQKKEDVTVTVDDPKTLIRTSDGDVKTVLDSAKRIPFR
jgi:hypothetical protein